jgi:hypothetical protein
MGLPLDIQQLILDELSEPIDAGNTVVAFHWQLPDAYWRTRFPLDMIFELDEISSDDMDWQYLFIEFGHLARSSRALFNRQRIFTVLRGTRDRFFKIFEEERS